MRPTTVGVVSIGDMGLGIAKLLHAHGYRVVTVGEGRSEHTLARIHSAAIETLSDQDLVIQADYVLSIVPPKHARTTAQRLAEAGRLPDTATRRQAIEDAAGQPERSRLYYVELNAIPARMAQEISEELVDARCHFLDGGIIGGPPQSTQDGTWTRPSLVLSGTVDLPPTFPPLASVLNMKLVSPQIGAASTLKLSFAALTKGLTALSILSFSTAQQESLLPELLEHLDQYSPRTAALARNGVVGMSPKAYRWVEEMHGIGEAFDTEGGWDGVGGRIYGGFAEIYRSIAEDPVLGVERVENRTRGTTVDDAAQLIARARHPMSSGGGRGD
ncbi:Dehydrogenase multihelical [Penicillium alfredii]|uniref:Dehydrogenase multihelical n=1 Tax=Penicillium alfredii TaxID=1506179 RepID=A0A9W9K7D3_9EURO|nr:Dehydrogenase multihelical [Penicillium alfredii]KAJ5095834.1 Dehydrogenase multihelical [Penicillium alfredii]